MAYRFFFLLWTLKKKKEEKSHLSVSLQILIPNNPENSGTTNKKWRLHIVIVLDCQSAQSVEQVQTTHRPYYQYIDLHLSHTHSLPYPPKKNYFKD